MARSEGGVKERESYRERIERDGQRGGKIRRGLRVIG